MLVTHDKTIRLQPRLLNQTDQWLVFLDDSRVPSTNNLAERTLRPLVIIRKITFGHRIDVGAERMAKRMTRPTKSQSRGYFGLLPRNFRATAKEFQTVHATNFNHAEKHNPIKQLQHDTRW